MTVPPDAYRWPRLGLVFVCPPATEPVAPMDLPVVVGFGAAYATKDGVPVIDGEALYRRTGRLLRLAAIEHEAAGSPPADWRVVLAGPMGGREYQRVGSRRWALVRTDEGLA